MGIVSDADFEREVTRTNVATPTPKKNDIVPSAVVEDFTKGRGNNPETPESLRKLIGMTAIESGRQEALHLAENFGLSPASVAAYTHGSNSTSTYEKQPNAPVIQGVKDRIAKRARSKVMLALGKITSDKLDMAKPRDLAGIAKDCASVVKSMEGDTSTAPVNNNGPTFVFYSPQVKKEESFDAVYVKE